MELWRNTFLVMATVASLLAVAAEENRGELGRVSSGKVDISLRINEDIRAGLLRRRNDTESNLKTLVSSGFVDGIGGSERATLSLCIISSGGSMFEVTALDDPTRAAAYNRFGTAVPLQVGFGADGRRAVMHRAELTGCSENAAVPVTVELKATGDPEAGRVHGRLELLVKSE